MQHHSNGRVVPPRQPQKQTDAEVAAEIQRYINSGHWNSCASEFTTPWSVGADGKYGVGSKANYALFWSVVKDLRAKGRVRSTDIAEAIFTMASNGVFERKPQVQIVEKPVEAPKPSARDLHNAQVKRDRAMNGDTSPIKGAQEKAKPLVDDHKPVLTEAQKEEINAKNARDNELVQTALWRVNSFTGRTHGHTASGRRELRTTFETAMDEGLEAQAVLDAVVAKCDQLAGNSSIR